MKFIDADVSVVGLGKLGASMAAAMAVQGLHVIGVDTCGQTVDAVNRGRAPVRETGLDEAMAGCGDRLRATMDMAEAVLHSGVTFVVVPTPSDERGAFSLDFAAACFEAMGKALKGKEGYHAIALTSTVLPGSTRHGLLPVLERASGRKCGRDFGLCYNPAFVALGSVIRDFLAPDFHLIGQFDERSGDAVAAILRRVGSNLAPMRRTTLENAELAKIAVNGFITLKISFGNLLAELCQGVPGGDVDAVSEIVGADGRIGRRCLTGGLGFGGPCFPRDNAALAFLGRQVGADTGVLAANDAGNRARGRRLLASLAGRIPASGKAAVLGLAYKPQTHVTEDSAGLALCMTLRDAGYIVAGYDPLAGEEASKILGKSAVAPSLGACVADADLVVVATPDPAFAALRAEMLGGVDGRACVVDCWRILNRSVQTAGNVDYVPAGRCIDPVAAESRIATLWIPERRPEAGVAPAGPDVLHQDAVVPERDPGTRPDSRPSGLPGTHGPQG
ncbi:MAG: nucleotide sugar dehydrogenase [Desulfovibrio sp.]|jgi:UDPglucose 6-dehydrogenase|nr:nucleotide sugar dehydrogenase [Desulfovibrio sp.]